MFGFLAKKSLKEPYSTNMPSAFKNSEFVPRISSCCLT